MNLYDVLAGQGTTHFERLFSQQFGGGGKMQTLTGVPPLSFTGNGSPLISLSMLGNAQQTGTPAPDNIIMPTFCGVRTGNLFDKDATNTANGYIANRYISNGGGISNSANHNVSEYINIPNNTEYITLSETKGASYLYASFYDSEKNVLSYFSYATMPRTVSVPSDAKYIRLTIPKASSNTTMLNAGSTALPYEPYGYKIPITCAGQTVPVYLGQTPTVRRIKKAVLTGEESDWINAAIITATDAYQNATAIAGYKREAFYCSHMVATTSSDSTTTHGYIGQRLTLCMDKTLGLDTVDKFKAYLAAQYAAGTPVTVWYVLATPETGIVNEPLAKIGDYADELHSTDAGVSIPTAKGQNTLTVDTELQPSEMTITFK